MVKGAWVTLATNDSYSLGALVLAHSLKQVGTHMELAILITPGVTNSMRARLSEVFNTVKEVNILDSKDKANLKLLQRPELGITFTKLHCWQLVQYEKCVFLDADTLVLQNCDELFDREELSAAPDVGWPDCFNSGVFVYRPSEETYNNLIQFALDKGSFDGGDQGVLNMFFSDWPRKDINKHLPFIYNVCSTAFYSYLPALKKFGKDVKIIHFIGNAKPWLQYFDTQTGKVRPSSDFGHLEAILQIWWNIFCSMIHPKLTLDMSSSYKPQHASARSPGQFPQQSCTESPTPKDCTNDKPSVWDPWEGYDRKRLNVPVHSTFESHNTIALSSVASRSFNKYSNPVTVDRNDQHSFNNSVNFKYSSNDRNCIDPSWKPQEGTFLFSSDQRQRGNSRINFETNRQSSTTFQVPIRTFQHSVSAIPVFQKASNPENNTSQSSPNLPNKFRHTNPEAASLPESPSPSQLETEEDSNIVMHAADRGIQESGLAGAFAKLTLGQQRTPEQEALENNLRRQNWEQGNIDYLGKDSFDNIWSKICETLAKGPEENEGDGSVPPPPEQAKHSAPKEGILPALQEVPKPSNSPKDIITPEKTPSDPIPLPPLAKPQGAVSTEIKSEQNVATETVSAVAETAISSPKQEPETEEVPIPVEPIPQPKTPGEASKVQVPSDIIPPSPEIPSGCPTKDASKTEIIEQPKAEIVEQPKPEILEQPKPGILEQPKPEIVEQPKAEIVEQPKPGILEQPKTEIVKQPKTEIVEQPKSFESESSAQGISKPASTPGEINAPSTGETIPSESEMVLQKSVSELQEKPLLSTEQIGLEKVVESPSIVPKPEEKKEDISPAPQKPTAPATEKISQPEEQIVVCPDTITAPTEKITPPVQVSSPKEPVQLATATEKTSAPQSIPSTETCPILKPTAPVESPKPKEIVSEKSQPPLAEIPSAIEKTPIAPIELPKEKPSESQQKPPVLPAESVTPQASNISQPPALASDESAPPPSISAPPRKNGGKKNQGKSKK